MCDVFVCVRTYKWARGETSPPPILLADSTCEIFNAVDGWLSKNYRRRWHPPSQGGRLKLPAYTVRCLKKFATMLLNICHLPLGSPLLHPLPYAYNTYTAAFVYLYIALCMDYQRISVSYSLPISGEEHSTFLFRVCLLPVSFYIYIREQALHHRIR